MILKMINHPTHPRSILSLQECGQFFMEELQSRLPERMRIVFSSDHPCKDQNIVIYDASVLELDESASKMDTPYVTSDKERKVMNLVFHRDQETFRVINVHVPGNPYLPGMRELATYVSQECQEDEVTICTGDMNFNEVEVKGAFDPVVSGYSLLSPYPTNIGDDFFSKCIDHFFIKGTDSFEINEASSLLPEVPEMVALLT